METRVKLGIALAACVAAVALAGCDNGNHQVQQLKLQLDETQTTANEARQKVEKLEAQVEELQGRVADLESDSSGPT
jgi:outer membrane murein-binding lipoprotein Lpp